jgi:ATP-dependent Clp protease adapter protein ClpS
MSTITEKRKKIKLRKPPKYCNVFLNNDTTPFEYVTHIFCKVFKYDPNTANQKAKEIHEKGKSIVFISSKEVCEAKRELVELEKSKIGETSLKHNVVLYGDNET